MPQIIMIITSAILTGLAQQPLGMGWLAWFSIIPFIIGIRNICSFKDHLKLGFTWGFFYNLTIIFWIAQNLGTNLTIGIISMFSAIILFSMNTILIVVAFYFIKRKFGQFSYLLLPFIWVSIEYIRSFGALANPWISLEFVDNPMEMYRIHCNPLELIDTPQSRGPTQCGRSECCVGSIFFLVRGCHLH